MVDAMVHGLEAPPPKQVYIYEKLLAAVSEYALAC